MPLKQVTAPYAHGYDFGVGVDLASGSPMGMVVKGIASGVTGAGGSIASFDVSRIRQTSELEERLGIDVQASYGVGAFAGVSARFNFAKTSKVQSSSLFMAITARVELEFISIDEPVLAPPAANIVNRQDVFSERYGNMFVRGIGRGGLFVGVLRIDAATSQSSDAISAELEGSYGLFSADAKMKFEKVRQNHRSEIHISVYHEGGPVNLALNSLDDPVELYTMLQKWLDSFQSDPESNSRPYYVTLAPITAADGPIPPNLAQIQHAQDVLVMCAKQRSRTMDHINLLEYIAHQPHRFEFEEPTTPGTVLTALNNYQSDLDTIAATASRAMNDISRAVSTSEHAVEEGIAYPKGMLPDPLPKLKEGHVQLPNLIPNFVGSTLKQAYALAEQNGFLLVGYEMQGPEDPWSPDWRELYGGYTDQDGREIPTRTLDQIIITWQQQQAGAPGAPGMAIAVAADLAPGVT
jgi:hypothetical protein